MENQVPVNNINQVEVKQKNSKIPFYVFFGLVVLGWIITLIFAVKLKDASSFDQFNILLPVAYTYLFSLVFLIVSISMIIKKQLNKIEIILFILFILFNLKNMFFGLI